LRLFRRQKSEPEVLAAVDLGSNSFHMIVMRLSHGQPVVLDRLREMVRLAAALDKDRQLDPKRAQGALDCLSRFGERLREIDVDWVRVVGTNTLRRIGPQSRFVEEAADLLGHPIEIISGIEEARLIYLGVSHSLPAVEGPQMVIDIGGGSTEIILGAGFEPQTMESLTMGCVGISNTHFANGKLSARRFKRARLAARLKLEPVSSRFSGLTPVRVVGASGTIRAAQRVISGIEAAEHAITRVDLEGLIKQMISGGQVDRLGIEGLAPQRAPVFPGGVAILVEIMSALNIETMDVSEGALREGIIYDMVGRLTDEDARVRSVRSMASRFHVDMEQAGRVERTAQLLFDQVSEDWKLDPVADRQMLSWAAHLHEIGLDISHAQYHLHGGYLLRHSNMPGFPIDEQSVLACLVEIHRNKFNRHTYEGVPDNWLRRTRKLALLLRLAVLFNRSRASVVLPELVIHVKGKKLTLELPPSWLEANPLTRASLDSEIERCKESGYSLSISETGATAEKVT